MLHAVTAIVRFEGSGTSTGTSSLVDRFYERVHAFLSGPIAITAIGIIVCFEITSSGFAPNRHWKAFHSILRKDGAATTTTTIIWSI